MEEWIARVWSNLGGRVDGPLSLRLLLQPCMAAVLGIISGIRDAREGRPPYFWTILTSSADRRELIRDGWKSIAKVFVAAVVIDTIYQFIALKRLYPLEAVIAGGLLALVPYLLIRGPANRIARMWIRK